MDVQDQLPLTESTFLITSSLAAGPKHGYAILRSEHSRRRGCGVFGFTLGWQ